MLYQCYCTLVLHCPDATDTITDTRTNNNNRLKKPTHLHCVHVTVAQYTTMQQYITTTGSIVSIVSTIIQYTQTTASIPQFFFDETKSSHESRTRDDAPDCFSCLIKNSHSVNLINI